MHLGGWEIILIVFIVLLLFGAKKIPELMRSFGKGVNSFKQGMKEEGPSDEVQSTKETDSEKKNQEKGPSVEV